jgi:hypothetical protein
LIATLAVLLLIPSAGFGRGVFGARLKQAQSVACCIAGIGEFSRWMGVGVRYFDTGAARGHPDAPHDGKINKIKLMAGVPGDLILYLAKTKGLSSPRDFTIETRITRRVARVHYEGQPDDRPPFRVETFNVRDTRVKKGEYLAVETVGPYMDALTCGGRRSGRLLGFQPPLDPGAGFTPYRGEYTCQLLIKALMR